MNRRIFFFAAALVFSSYSSAYTNTTPFSSFEVLDESDFFNLYSSPVLITNLYVKGDNAQPDSWIIRGYWGGTGFWEDVSFGYERGLDSPYPIERTGGSLNTTQPILAISTPDTLTDAVPLAVYTDQGFFGIVPNGPNDKFYPLYAVSGGSAVSTIYSINTVSLVPEINSTIMITVGLLLLLLAQRRRAQLPARRADEGCPTSRRYK